MSDHRGAAGEPDAGGSRFVVLPCACANLRRAARAVTRLYDDELRAVGLTIAQFTLLQVLSQTGTVTQGRLGRILLLDSTTLSRTLRPLEGSGWVRRRPGKDRRERRIELTPAGRSRFRQAVPAWNRAQRILRDRIGDRRWKALMSELAAVARASRQG
jgi:DNA-binding MarR family transcriptional regulator